MRWVRARQTCQARRRGAAAGAGQAPPAICRPAACCAPWLPARPQSPPPGPGLPPVIWCLIAHHLAPLHLMSLFIALQALQQLPSRAKFLPALAMQHSMRSAHRNSQRHKLQVEDGAVVRCQLQARLYERAGSAATWRASARTACLRLR